MRPVLLMAPAMILLASATGGIASDRPSFYFGFSSGYRDAPQRPADCHHGTHNHYVPEWGVSVPHHHDAYCNPVRDENDMGGAPRRHHRRHYNYDDNYDDNGYDDYNDGY